MTDYSFMQSGLTGDYNPMASFNTEDLILLLGVFAKNAIIKASRHVNLCGRNGVTKKDMEYALKYEVFDFLDNPDVFAEISRIRNAIQEEELEDEDEEYESEEELEETEEETGIAEELTDAIIGDNVVPDDEIQEYTEISHETASIEDQEFLRNFYRYAETWNTWEPNGPIESALHGAINRI
jgi:hypothetical protein